jgi:putative endonuclease
MPEAPPPRQRRHPGNANGVIRDRSRHRDMQFYVYILSNVRRGVLYTGITNNLVRRAFEHREKTVDGFAERHSATRLVYFECHRTSEAAITREKAIKRWRREWKFELIESRNPDWNDLWDEIIK